jgi:hypothetical protein
VLGRVEHVAETLRAALNALALEAPDWLRAQVPPDWYERYGRRIEELANEQVEDLAQHLVADRSLFPRRREREHAPGSD